MEIEGMVLHNSPVRELWGSVLTGKNEHLCYNLAHL